jgi:nicotinamidase-related amidase
MLIEHAKSQLLLVDLQERLMPAMADTEPLAHNVEVLLQAARVLDVPVLASEQYPAGLGPTIAMLADQLVPGERLIKTEFSCYANPELRTRLDRAPSQIILAGIEAHVCVQQTAFELAAAGRRVFVVADAVSARSLESKAIALQRMAAAGIFVVTTEMVLFEWLRRADRPDFKPLSRLIR